MPFEEKSACHKDSKYTGFMENLYIFGAGEFAQIAWSYFAQEGKYEMCGFILDDGYELPDSCFFEDKVVFRFSDVANLLTAEKTKVFVAISASQMNWARSLVFRRLKAHGCTFASYISPFAFVSFDAYIGSNVFIFEHNVVQNGVRIGDNTVLWSGNHVGHQSVIGSNVFISSHVVVSGFCKIGDFSYLGVNSTVVDHINIGDRSLIGAGSLVLKDTQENSVYFGSPAKKIEGKNPSEVVFR